MQPDILPEYLLKQTFCHNIAQIFCQKISQTFCQNTLLTDTSQGVMVRVKPSSFGLSPSHHPLELQMPCLPLAQVTGDLCRFTLWCTNRRASDRNQKSFIGGEIIHENYEQSPSTENGLEWLLSSKPGQCDCQIRFVFLPTTASLLVHDALALSSGSVQKRIILLEKELRAACRLLKEMKGCA